jgi:hypothetical protein
MTLMQAIVLCFLSSALSAAGGVWIGSRGKLGKVAHTQYCPENRNVMTRSDHKDNCPENREVLTKTEHDRGCELKMVSIQNEISQSRQDARHTRRIVEAVAIKLNVRVAPEK